LAEVTITTHIPQISPSSLEGVMAYLLPEKRALCFEFADITFIECEEELLDPFVRSTVQRVQDGVD
jgi:hypothetical protein